MIKSSRSRLSAKLKAKAGDTDRDLDYSGYHRKQIKGNNNYYNTALNKITTNTINESVCELYLSNGITYYINLKKGQIMPSWTK